MTCEVFLPPHHRNWVNRTTYGGGKHQPHPGARICCYGCSLPGLTGFTTYRRGGTGTAAIDRCRSGSSRTLPPALANMPFRQRLGNGSWHAVAAQSSTSRGMLQQPPLALRAAVAALLRCPSASLRGSNRLVRPGVRIPRVISMEKGPCGPLFHGYGGEGGIRTPGPRKGSLDFESSPFDRSGTSPGWRKARSLQ